MTKDRPVPHFGLVLDCADPEPLARFWSEALDYTSVGAAGSYVALSPRHGGKRVLRLQQRESCDVGSRCTVDDSPIVAMPA